MQPRRAILLDEISQSLANAAHGERGRLAAEAATALGVTLPTLYRQLAQVAPSGRKRRADAGAVELSRDEAAVISALLMEGYRQNGKKMLSIESAVEMLRANGKVTAGRVDSETGEFFPLSTSAIARALRAYTLHPDQLRRPTPHHQMASRHPNHVWQVDGSVCVLFYLPGQGSAIVETDEAVHYKNKPENLRAIEKMRVIRYVVTDHASGVVRWRYYPHAETSAHTVHFLAWAMAPKPDRQRDPFHGRPRILMVDPGATGGGLVKRFCDRLGVQLIVNKSRNARAKGQVENGQNLVETQFEQGLRFARQQVRDFDDLNRLADVFQLHYNATRKHTRHGLTRFDAWMHIRADELVTTQSAEVLLLLATHEPESRTVNGDLTIEFKRRTWRVDHVPGVIIGGKLPVHWHPFIANTAMAVIHDADGAERHIELVDVTGEVDPRNQQWGFARDAAIIGEEHKARPDTAADTNRKAGHQIAAGLPTLEQVEKARRRADYEPFGGAIDPYLTAKTAPTPDYLPKTGTALEVGTPTVERIPVALPALALRCKQALEAAGGAWGREQYIQLAGRYPEGAPEDEVAAIIAAFASGAGLGRPVLRIVGDE